MRVLLAGLLVTTLGVTPAISKPRHCMFRVHVEANEHDGQSFASSIKAQLSGRTVAIEQMPRISEQDVIGFKFYPRDDGTFGALIELDDHGRIGLDTLSVERKGRYAFIFVNGRPITEMMIDKRISDGKIYIASGLTAADIGLMKKDWKLLKPPKAAQPVKP